MPLANNRIEFPIHEPASMVDDCGTLFDGNSVTEPFPSIVCSIPHCGVYAGTANAGTGSHGPVCCGAHTAIQVDPFMPDCLGRTAGHGSAQNSTVHTAVGQPSARFRW